MRNIYSLHKISDRKQEKTGSVNQNVPQIGIIYKYSSGSRIPGSQFFPGLYELYQISLPYEIAMNIQERLRDILQCTCLFIPYSNYYSNRKEVTQLDTRM